MSTSLEVVQSAMQGLSGLRITSTYRDPDHNRRVGGSPTSLHMQKDNPAVDVAGDERSLDELERRLASLGHDAELLWRTAGHYDHLHYGIRGGGSGMPVNAQGWSNTAPWVQYRGPTVADMQELAEYQRLRGLKAPSAQSSSFLTTLINGDAPTMDQPSSKGSQGTMPERPSTVINEDDNPFSPIPSSSGEVNPNTPLAPNPFIARRKRR